MALPVCPSPLPSGYSPTIKGQLLHVDTTSSMQYRTLLEAEMLAVSRRALHEDLSSVFLRLSNVKSFFFLLYVSVSRHSQLPSGVEHASVVAV